MEFTIIEYIKLGIDLFGSILIPFAVFRVACIQYKDAKKSNAEKTSGLFFENYKQVEKGIGLAIHSLSIPMEAVKILFEARTHARFFLPNDIRLHVERLYEKVNFAFQLDCKIQTENGFTIEERDNAIKIKYEIIAEIMREDILTYYKKDYKI